MEKEIVMNSTSSNSVNNSIYETYGQKWYTADDDPVALLRHESKAKTPWVIENIKAKFPLNSTTQVLDVGCGGGFLSNELAKQNLSVTGVDIAEDSIQVAALYDSTKSVKYLQADAYQLPFPDASFDVITAMDFLEHVENPQKVIREFSRVLKPDGLFIFHTFNRNILAYLVIIKLVEWLVKNTPKNMHILRLFVTPQEARDYCSQAGLRVEKMTGIKPVFSSIPLKNIFSGVVPRSLKFELTSSLMLSYMGSAVKLKTSL